MDNQLYFRKISEKEFLLLAGIEYTGTCISTARLIFDKKLVGGEEQVKQCNTVVHVQKWNKRITRGDH